MDLYILDEPTVGWYSNRLYASAGQVIKTTIDAGTVIESGLVYIPKNLVILGLTTVLVGGFFQENEFDLDLCNFSHSGHLSWQLT